MNYAFRASTLAITLFSLAFFSSCSKGGGCDQPSPIIINHNGPVVEGWNLDLRAEYATSQHTYKWSGPNGWTAQTSGSNADLVSIENITAAGSGEYKLQLVSKGCVEYEGKVDIEVIAPPAPPCTVAANTATSSVAGVGGYSFTYRNFGASSGHYMVEATQAGDGMTLSFVGNDPPVPGTYKTNGYWGMEPGKVGLYIGAGVYDFVANPDQTVYVTKVNNKLEVSFCTVRFNNPLGSAVINVSARIVQP
jgi:hypothetical protein